MYNLYIPLASLLLNIFLIVLYLFKTSKLNKENNFYFGMIIDTFFMTVFCIIAVYLLYIQFPDLSIIKLANKFECVFIFNFFMNLLMYVLFSANVKINNMMKWYVFINILISFFIFITPVYLEVTSDLTYMVSVGPSTDITTIASGIVLVITFITALKHKEILKDKILPIILLLIFIVLIVFIRSAIPEFICLEFLATFATLIMYHTIENPDLILLEQMEDAKIDAEKANRAKSDFLSSMSHEIRTPLNTIVGLSELNLEVNDNKELKENSKDILNASNILLDIIGNVLDMSKIESGSFEISNTTYNPNELLRSVIKVTEYKFVEKNIDFKVNIAPDLPSSLYGDQSNIKKILINLLGNASKYTKEGYVIFTVNCINQGDVSKLIISVEDTGRGIKPEQINKLFAKFDRLDEEKNTTTEGTGLGLAITKHLIEAMNGSINVQSVYGQGSKFTVILDQKIKTETKEEKTITQSTKEFLDLSNKKILLIDDNNMNLKVAEKFLKEYKCEVTGVLSGRECIDLINSGKKYDLLLVDEMMPEMSGTEMMKYLKENGYAVPIVVMTADVIDNAKQKYLKEGFDDYLAKPINRTELDNVLRKYLNEL